jgi:3-oxoacyl-[acyl-carrier protein] reductase
MDLGLTGKVAIVAASSKGLGRAVAMTLAREGAVVTINGRDAETLTETARAIRNETGSDVLAITGDMANPQHTEWLVSETVNRRGGLDILVCNAGGPPGGKFADFPVDDPWLSALNMNLMSTLRLSRAAVPHLEAQGGGSITNIVSTTVKQPIPGLILSTTARTAVIGLAKELSNELAGKKIRVNCVCPGRIMTDRIRSLAANQARDTGKSVDEVLAEDAKSIPLGRIGDPQEFANAVVFLASPTASYITGVTLQVDGGMVKGLM